MKVLKPNSVITGIDFSLDYYSRLQALALFIAKNENEEYKHHLETVLILLNTLDEEAENQGLTEELDVISGE